MHEREYIIQYSQDARKRLDHKAARGKIVSFMVQLELKHEGSWKEVVRYDCAHNYAHRDSYNMAGKHVKKELYLSFEDALTLADDDIDDNWENYKFRFMEGGLP